eukprot:scaffold114547_cov69-Phaeocystis_antarctica.AAC.2
MTDALRMTNNRFVRLPSRRADADVLRHLALRTIEFMFCEGRRTLLRCVRARFCCLSLKPTR